jgi:hypothetical protein
MRTRRPSYMNKVDTARLECPWKMMQSAPTSRKCISADCMAWEDNIEYGYCKLIEERG